uniref:Uncharacterized protein n=1 Tax=Rhizophora mucronata TaxID=61149 RepID=A0A2P2Q0H8_RHIMU
MPRPASFVAVSALGNCVLLQRQARRSRWVLFMKKLN